MVLKWCQETAIEWRINELVIDAIGLGIIPEIVQSGLLQEPMRELSRQSCGGEIFQLAKT